MLTSMMFYVFVLSSVFVIGENTDTQIEKIDNISDGLELRIIAEERQSVENGLRFSVELENKLDEPFSLKIRTRGENFQRSRRTDKEEEFPFKFRIIDRSKGPTADLAQTLMSNFMGFPLPDYERTIIIEGNSIIQLGSVVFSEYITIISPEGEIAITPISPGTYYIDAHLPAHVKKGLNHYTEKLATISTERGFIAIVLE